MKKQESFDSQFENEREVVLTEEMKRHNPDKFWEGFIKQSGQSVFNVLLNNIDPNGQALQRAVSDMYKGLKKDYQKIISEEDILRYALEYYRDHEDQNRKPYQGFGKANGLEEKYEELCHKAVNEKKNESEARALQAFQKMIEPEEGEGLDFDNANGPIEALVAQVIEEAHPSEEEVSAFRTKLWNILTEKSMSK
jgi:hypothetical protein